MTYTPDLPPVVSPPWSMLQPADWTEFVRRYLSDQGQFRDVFRAWSNVVNGDVTTLQTDLDAVEADIAALPTFPLSIANGGTSASSKTNAYNALTPITTKGDLVVGRGANQATRLAVGATNGYPLVVDSAATNGVKWATTQPTLALHQIAMYARPLFNATSSADPAVPTLAATDTTLTDATDGDGFRAGKNFVDGSITWLGWSFCIPADLDTTAAINVYINAVLVANASTGDAAEFTCRYRATKLRERHLDGGATGAVNAVAVLTSHVAGDNAQITISAAIPANTVEAYDHLNGVIERDARSSNSDDTYANTLVVISVLFEGKRKLWS